MNEDEFRRSYARLEEDIKASDELKYRTKESLGLAKEPSRKASHSHAREARPALHKRSPSRKDRSGAITLPPAMRTALTACLAVAAGVGLLFGTGALDKVGAYFAGNSFALVAYAEESPAGAYAPAGIGLEKFYPSRTSAGYLYDATSDTVDPSVVTVSRYYAFDMTVSGNNVESVAYSIEGEGVSYGSWKSGQGGEGRAAEESSKSFVVSYDDGRQVVREIGLSYVLDEEEKTEFDRLYAENDAYGMETLLATCDAKRLAETTVTATATFLDGTSQTKSYGFKPVEGFASMYSAYLSQLTDTEDSEAWESLAGEPSLFEFVEKGR